MSLLLTMVLSMVALVYGINRPVYKIVLTQKGYAQFLQYDVDTPPLREFTYCTWIRVFDLANDQSIFTYVANGNNRVVRLWLDSGGEYMRISILGRVTSKVRVDVVKDVWRHVCLSYQSDFGAWALYLDSRLISCEAAQSLYGYVLPGGGSVIIGYGTASNGAPNGLEGEIFGANMILSSTIERNYTMKVDPVYEQKQFARNKLKKEINDNNYVILSDLMTDEVQNNFEKTYLSTVQNTSKNFIKLQTPHSFVEHSVGVDFATKNPQMKDISIEQDFFYTMPDFRTTNKEKSVSWSTDSLSKYKGKMKKQTTKHYQGIPVNSDVQDTLTISEYETPPPLIPPSIYFDNNLDVTEQSITDSNFKPKDYKTNDDTVTPSKNSVNELSETETPPPIQKNTKVYGQWTSSKYAGTVLDYLKSINFKNGEHILRKVPQTIPLHKVSDSHPYSSDFKITRLRPPSEFKRRNVVEKRYDIIKRDPQINVQILEEDLRSKIIKMHAEAHPKKVEIIHRGKPKKRRDHRFYRNAQYDQDYDEKSDSTENIYDPKPFTVAKDENNHKHFVVQTPNKLQNPVRSLLKPLDYNNQDIQNTHSQTVTNSNDMYSKSLSNGNKWHNVKSYNNDYTPRKINMNSEDTEINSKKQYPSIRLNYVHEKRNNIAEEDMSKSRKLASDVSHQSSLNQDSVSILKYNQGYLSTQEEITKADKNLQQLKRKLQSKRNMGANSFDKHVKIGNALNERTVIGENEEQNKQSFIGGNENIPDINRFRSDLDNENDKVPPSLGPRICKNVELYDRVLYVQQDGSIDMTHILSPVREKNVAIGFIMLNYKKCSLTESSFKKNALLFIDWSKTPVRLFGGAYPQTTTDLCGFF